MFTIIEVELSNFRSHKSFTFQPDADGVTAISGANGTGKSTIVDSIAWALYGVKPSGVSSNAKFIREGTDPKKEKVFVAVTLQLSDVELKVTRRIVNKTGSVECEVYSYNQDTKEYESIAGPAVSHSEPYIRSRLKIDAKGFLASVLIQQKQVDNLISSGAKERAQVIEKLTGISSLTEALEYARKEENALKKAIKVFDYQPKEKEKLEKEKTSLEGKVEKKKQALRKLEATLEENRAKYLELKQDLDDKESVFNKNTSIDNKITRNSTLIESSKKELERVLKQKEEKKRQLPKKMVRPLKSIQPELTTAQEKLQNILTMVSKVKDRITFLNEENITLQEIINDSGYSTVADVEKKVGVLGDRIRKGEENLTRIDELLYAGEADIKKTRKAISVISTGDNCPMCLQKVKEFEKVLEVLNAEVAGLEEGIEKNKRSKRSIREKLEELVGERDSLLVLIDSFKTLESNTVEVKSLTKKSAEGQGKADKIQGIVDVLTQEFSQSEQYDGVKREYDSVLAYSVELSDKIEELQQENITLDKSRVGGRVTLDHVSAARGKVDSVNTRIQEFLVKVGDAREDYVEDNSRLTFMQETLDRLTVEAEKYVKLLESIEVSSATTSVVQEFREERIKTSIPVVEAYASEFLSKFTEGKFTGLVLDERFNSKVVMSNGVTRPVGLLSGGELSAAALSLRLAISMLLNNNSQNSTIILDEVLVSQDDTRSELILSAIKELLNGQVIMISHGSTTTSIADKIVQL